MSNIITPEQHTSISADLASKIASKVGTKVWVQINYGTVNSSVYGTLAKTDAKDSCWDYRLHHESGGSAVYFNIDDCYEVMYGTIFLGTR